MRTRTRSARPLAVVVSVFALAAGLVSCGDDAPDEPAATVPANDDANDDVNDEALEFDDDLVVGLPVEEAEQVADDEGFVFRIAVLDGEDQALTMDFVPNRVNVAVDDGIVTGVEFVG